MHHTKTIESFQLMNKNGMSARILSFGGIIAELKVPDKHGKLENVVLGLPQPEDYVRNEYLQHGPYLGAIVGRYANRIAQGRFSLNGQTVQLAKNNQGNHLHGGNRGFDKVFWEARQETHENAESVYLTYESPDNEENYPGHLKVQVEYRLNDQNELLFFAEATTNSPTHVNLTNHTYFNLNGMKRNVKAHRIHIDSHSITETDNKQIPTGKICTIENSPFDFRSLKVLGDTKISGKFLGFDHNYILSAHSRRDKKGYFQYDASKMHFAAEARDPDSGRGLIVLTNQPGLQFYTGNGLDGRFLGSHGKKINAFDGFCFEPQFFPDTPNKKHFPSSLLKPGETYRHMTVYKFF